VESRPGSTFAKREHNSINATAGARSRRDHPNGKWRAIWPPQKNNLRPHPKTQPALLLQAGQAGCAYASGSSEEQHCKAKNAKKSLIIALRPVSEKILSYMFHGCPLEKIPK
jgi:hypothetical protein